MSKSFPALNMLKEVGRGSDKRNEAQTCFDEKLGAQLEKKNLSLQSRQGAKLGEPPSTRWSRAPFCFVRLSVEFVRGETRTAGILV